MIRIIFCIFIYCAFINASDLKITSITQTNNGVSLSFNKAIKASAFKAFTLKNNDEIRYVYDISADLLGNARVFEFEGDVIVKIAQNAPNKVRLVLSTKKELRAKWKYAQKKAILEIPNAKSVNQVSIASLFDTHKKENKSTINTKAESTKQKIIVIDPGHGGKDCGAVGIDKVCEKTIVLNIGKYLSEELKKRGYKVYMTRSKDVFISLRDRTKFANNKNADLFISIHANAVSENKTKLQGIESYFLSTARSERAKKVAALENKDDTEVMNYFSKQSFLNTLNTQRIVASNRLAIDIQYGMLQSVKKNYSVVDGGVREGPFWVLVGAIMPSVLIESGYLTHPTEGKRLTKSSFQKALSIGIANGVDGYFLKNP
ncbi:N-acetylmuramoyl-L-alanine amidase [Helicobacter sp. WB40]|uniref:N-acetylmuramoyl-L-alanine amidase n=1 Tax=Helicobacter sp. WB40 TaxID=3004130 RepID=UPI0022EBD628|nr:N-acetylmuramoyl-L-alanine amidase [Helicobacter sp. WB40]MDA3966802.1 N-acetylmuramoyl-L-alanine amidase [Helicobacter sp. WB40]